MTARSRIEVRRTLAAPPARVFGAFADPALVAKWLRPSPDIELTVLDFHFEVGGRYRYAYLTPEGMRMVVGGVFQEIEAPSRIDFTWLIEPPDEHAGIESLVTVRIAPAVAGSELTIQHARFERPDAEARHEAGWHGALALLDGLLESGEGA